MPMTTRHARVPAQAVCLALAVLAALLFGPLPAAQAAVSGTVDVASGDTLRVRSQPNTSSTIVANLADGATVSISCKVTGTTVTGTFGTTSVWYKISSGYATAAYVRAASTVSSCTTSTPTGRVDVASGTTLNVRSGPGSGYSITGTLADGATVALSCQTMGTQQSGTFGTTSVWYKISSGYVTAAYVKASATPSTCSTTAPPPSTTAAQKAINFGLSQLSSRINSVYVGACANAGNARLGYPVSTNTYHPECSSTGQSNYYQSAGRVGYDCSGLVWRMFKEAGVSFNHYSSSTMDDLPQVTKTVANLRPGDLLVRPGRHVAMYIGSYNNVPSIIEATPYGSKTYTTHNGYTYRVNTAGVQILAASVYINDSNYTAHRVPGI